MSELLDAAGRRRSPATLPEFHARRPPRNKGMRYPADPPTIQEIVTVMRCAGDAIHGRRLRGLIVVLWRARRRGRTGRPGSSPAMFTPRTATRPLTGRFQIAVETSLPRCFTFRGAPTFTETTLAGPVIIWMPQAAAARTTLVS
jgi:hypothetical protein